MPSQKPPKEAPPINKPEQTDDDNPVRQAQSKGVVRPDGPGDETAPAEREMPSTGGPAIQKP